MKVEGEYSFAVDRETLWAGLLDPDVPAGCIPGCRELNRVGDDRYDVLLKVKVGPVTGN